MDLFEKSKPRPPRPKQRPRRVLAPHGLQADTLYFWKISQVLALRLADEYLFYYNVQSWKWVCNLPKRIMYVVVLVSVLKPKDAAQYVIFGDLTASATGSKGGDESLARELSR